MFDSSVARGEPASMSLNEVIAGWTRRADDGRRRESRFWIPARLAYAGKDGPQGMLVFDIELIRIES